MCPPVPIQLRISHDYSPNTQKFIICLFICLITSHQQPSFKLRAQSCLNCPISLVKSQGFQKTWGRLHACGPGALTEITCVHQWEKNATWLKVFLTMSLHFFIHFFQKSLFRFLAYLQGFTILSTGEFLTFRMNSLPACPKWEGRCQKDAPESDREHGRTWAGRPLKSSMWKVQRQQLYLWCKE